MRSNWERKSNVLCKSIQTIKAFACFQSKIDFTDQKESPGWFES